MLWRGVLLAALCFESGAGLEFSPMGLNAACWFNLQVNMTQDGVVTESDACGVAMEDSTLIVDIVKCVNVAIFYSAFIFTVKALCLSTV
eukprot:g27826.t1